MPDPPIDIIVEPSEQLVCRLIHDTAIVTGAEARQLLDQLVAGLFALAEAPDAAVSTVNLASDVRPSPPLPAAHPTVEAIRFCIVSPECRRTRSRLSRQDQNNLWHAPTRDDCGRGHAAPPVETGPACRPAVPDVDRQLHRPSRHPIVRGRLCAARPRGAAAADGDHGAAGVVAFIGLLLNMGDAIAALADAIPLLIQSMGASQRVDMLLDAPVSHEEDAAVPSGG